MIVTVQGSNVRSPATGRTRPLNGTGMFPRLAAGISAALTRNSMSLSAMLLAVGKSGIEVCNELYDLVADIGETTNLYDQHPARFFCQQIAA